MRVAKSTKLLPVTTFLLAGLLAAAAPSPVVAALEPPIARHEAHEHGEGMMDMGSAGGEEEAEETQPAPAEMDPPASSVTGHSDLPSPSPSAPAHPPHGDHAGHADSPPDPHAHGSHAAPLDVLNDTDIHRWHKFPPTYLDADFRLDADSAIFGEEFDASWDLSKIESHKGMAGVHAALMMLAYFGVLPISLALRAADHPFHYIANVLFLAVAILGWLVGAAYRAASPDLYEGAVYPTFLNVLLTTSIALTVFDSLALVRRVISWYRTHDRSWASFVDDVLRRSPGAAGAEDKWSAAGRYEMVGLVEHEEDAVDQRVHVGETVFAIGEDEDLQDVRLTDEPEHHGDEHDGDHHAHFDEHDHELNHEHVARTLLRGVHPHRPSLLIRQYSSPSRTSTGSDGTLQDTPGSSTGYLHKASQLGAYDAHSPLRHSHHGQEVHNEPVWQSAKAKGWRRAAEVVVTVVRRTQVVFAYVTMLAAFVTYTGMCRAGLINSCAAHYVKGSIFFWYGVLTFARYLGAYADLGWAWNARPAKGSGISAEMIECFVIFLYGVTNTWMERFGAAPGSAYTVKQVQHISIAVMFWFAGLSGMLLESKWMRKVMASVMSGGKASTREPLSYAFSYNPLPALVIGVTGLAMAAHHQTYVFQVQIHSLWGLLLAGGSLFRCLTYIFLFLRPPSDSVLPSRPPTEILTAFGWAAGGIVFMLSNEEIAWAAIRTGWDDMMAFLCFTIALTSLVFCWAIVVMGVKGWAVMRRRVEEERRREVGV
ncbi:hypothetical protein IAT38_002293 [Cryptococcus sp. DSM 104549]